LATVINTALANKSRFDTMTEFFGGVGKDHTAGVWEQGRSETPQDRPEFKEHTRRHVIKMIKKRKAEEMI
ncbi:MAG: chlorophyllide a reductase subunit Y, partial [Burkholderiaceae bacterium]